MTLIVEHRLELLAAFAMAGGVLDQHRGIDIVLAAEQSDTANAPLRTFAGETDEFLIADDSGIGREIKAVKQCKCADRSKQSCDMYSARLSDLDVVDLCFVSDYQFERGIDLRITAFMAFDDRRLGTLLHDDQRTYESGARLIATGQENEIDRSLQCGAGGYADHCTVAHQGGVDRLRHVIGHEGLAYANRHQP